MFKFIKQAFIALWSFRELLARVPKVSGNDKITYYEQNKEKWKKTLHQIIIIHNIVNYKVNYKGRLCAQDCYRNLSEKET